MTTEVDRDARDAALADLLAGPAPQPDPRFVARVMTLVEADRRLTLARRAAWRRFAVEALAAGAIALSLVALTRLSGGAGVVPAGPATAGCLALLAWLGAGQGARTQT